MQEFTSANTSINSTKVPALFKKVDWSMIHKNVDIGGGKFDTATDYLATLGVVNVIFDPYNRSEKHNLNTVMDLAINPAETATISNVLNVIKEKDKRIEVLKLARKWSKMCFISVYEGNKSGSGKVSKKGCWQENRKLVDYITEVQEVFPNVKITRGFIVAW